MESEEITTDSTRQVFDSATNLSEASTANMTSNVDTIDCLPIPPPYSAEPEPGSSHCSHSGRSISVQNILDYEDMETQRSKVCCSMILCKYCLSGCLKFRRVLFMMSTAGALSILGAVILGAARTSQNNFLTLSLMFGGKIHICYELDFFTNCLQNISNNPDKKLLRPNETCHHFLPFLRRFNKIRDNNSWLLYQKLMSECFDLTISQT